MCGRAPRQAPLDTTCHPPAHAGLSRYRPRPHGPQGDNTSRGGQSQRQGKQSDNGASKAKAKATPAPASSDTGPHGARGRVTHPVARCRNPTLPPAPRRDRPPPANRISLKHAWGSVECRPRPHGPQGGNRRCSTGISNHPPTSRPSPVTNPVARTDHTNPEATPRSRHTPTHQPQDISQRWCAANRTRPHGPQDDNDQP